MTESSPWSPGGVGKGANVLIEGRHLTVIVANARSGAVDALALQLGASGTVRSDDDLVFYNQLASPEGAVRLTAPDTFTVDLEQVPISVATLAIGVTLSDEGPGSAIPAGIGVTVESRNDRYWAPTEGLTTERAAILIELYRRNSTWKLRNVSAGWEQGLSAMVTHHGVAVDDGPRTTPAATVDAAWASLSISPAPPSMVLPANESDGSSDRSEVTRAPFAKSRSHKRIAWLVAVVATLLLLVAISGRAPDRSAPVAMVNARIAQTSSSATSSTGKPSIAPVAAMNSSSPEVSPTAAGNSDAGKALAAPAAVPVVREGEGAQSAVTALEALRVAGRAPRTGYSRARFGRSWTDDVDVDGGHNGCDTRNDVLRRDLQELTLRPGSGGCVVTAGTFTDPYTGRPLQFTAGKQSAVQIDHVVSLSNAWQTGAASITAVQRQNLANDPLNLQSTASAINQAKGDGDAATWLPPNKAYRCTYVARQVAVKAKYRLWVTFAERQAISTVLATCGAKPASPPIISKPPSSQVASTPMGRTVAPPVVTVLAAPSTTTTVAPQAVTLLAAPTAPPTTTGTPPPAETTNPPAETTNPPPAETTTPPSAETTTPPPAEVLAPTPESTESATETPAAQADSGVYYANCAAARAAGAAPLNRGEPGYRAGLDRDHDGIACET